MFSSTPVQPLDNLQQTAQDITDYIAQQNVNDGKNTLQQALVAYQSTTYTKQRTESIEKYIKELTQENIMPTFYLILSEGNKTSSYNICLIQDLIKNLKKYDCSIGLNEGSKNRLIELLLEKLKSYMENEYKNSKKRLKIINLKIDEIKNKKSEYKRANKSRKEFTSDEIALNEFQLENIDHEDVQQMDATSLKEMENKINKVAADKRVLNGLYADIKQMKQEIEKELTDLQNENENLTNLIYILEKTLGILELDIDSFVLINDDEVTASDNNNDDSSDSYIFEKIDMSGSNSADFITIDSSELTLPININSNNTEATQYLGSWFSNSADKVCSLGSYLAAYSPISIFGTEKPGEHEVDEIPESLWEREMRKRHGK